MVSQLSFPGLEAQEERPRTDRVFFAVFPDPATASRISGVAETLRSKHDLVGSPLQRNRFHITVNHLDDFAGLPERIVPAALEAGQKVVSAPFEVVFDRAASFQGRRDKKPFVLLGAEGLEKLVEFQQTLAVAMAHAGLGRYVEKRFTPHMTLLYDAGAVSEEPIEPIRWTVRELVLVHSMLGQTQHIPLGRWTL